MAFGAGMTKTGYLKKDMLASLDLTECIEPLGEKAA